MRRTNAGRSQLDHAAVAGGGDCIVLLSMRIQWMYVRGPLRTARRRARSLIPLGPPWRGIGRGIGALVSPKNPRRTKWLRVRAECVSFRVFSLCVVPKHCAGEVMPWRIARQGLIRGFLPRVERCQESCGSGDVLLRPAAPFTERSGRMQR